MTNQPFSTQGTSAAFEAVALTLFRRIVAILPPNCKVSREVWNHSTVLCLDFQDCSYQLDEVKKQSVMLLLGASHLGLAQSISFRLGQKIEGWMNLTAGDS